jgi:predicted anti-sigma-YlaC factor YlaD
MNCAYCEERLSDYLENTLADSERALVALHLQSCAACGALCAGVAEVMNWGKVVPVRVPPEWLPSRIVANTPRVVRVTWRDWFAGAWRTVAEPRFALALFTTVILFGWLNTATAFGSTVTSIVRDPAGVYHGVEGLANRAYAEAVRNYYSSPLVIEIQNRLYRIGQLRENS